MARVTIEDCLKMVDSRFQLVHLAVRRVLQLRNGALSQVDAPKNKEVVVALREIARGKVTLENIRQFEEVRKIEPSTEKEEATRAEIQDILGEIGRFEPAPDLSEVDEIMVDADED